MNLREFIDGCGGLTPGTNKVGGGRCCILEARSWCYTRGRFWRDEPEFNRTWDFRELHDIDVPTPLRTEKMTEIMLAYEGVLDLPEPDQAALAFRLVKGMLPLILTSGLSPCPIGIRTPANISPGQYITRAILAAARDSLGDDRDHIARRVLCTIVHTNRTPLGLHRVGQTGALTDYLLACRPLLAEDDPDWTVTGDTQTSYIAATLVGSCAPAYLADNPPASIYRAEAECDVLRSERLHREAVFCNACDAWLDAAARASS